MRSKFALNPKLVAYYIFKNHFIYLKHRLEEILNEKNSYSKRNRYLISLEKYLVDDMVPYLEWARKVTIN